MATDPATTKPPRARSFLVAATILGGAGLIAYGSWLTYPPAGFIVGGVLLLAEGLAGSRR